MSCVNAAMLRTNARHASPLGTTGKWSKLQEYANLQLTCQKIEANYLVRTWVGVKVDSCHCTVNTLSPLVKGKQY